MKILLTVIKYMLLAFVAIGLCLLLVAAVVTKEWLLIPVALLPVLAFFWPINTDPHR